MLSNESIEKMLLTAKKELSEYKVSLESNLEFLRKINLGREIKEEMEKKTKIEDERKEGEIGSLQFQPLQRLNTYAERCLVYSSPEFIEHHIEYYERNHINTELSKSLINDITAITDVLEKIIAQRPITSQDYQKLLTAKDPDTRIFAQTYKSLMNINDESKLTAQEPILTNFSQANSQRDTLQSLSTVGTSDHGHETIINNSNTRRIA